MVKAVTSTMKGNFPGLGMASVERDSSIAPAILELAETRAIARSLRFAGYGVEYCSAEMTLQPPNPSFTRKTKVGRLFPRACKILFPHRPVSWSLFLDLPSGPTI